MSKALLLAASVILLAGCASSDAPVPGPPVPVRAGGQPEPPGAAPAALPLPAAAPPALTLPAAPGGPDLAGNSAAGAGAASDLGQPPFMNAPPARPGSPQQPAPATAPPVSAPTGTAPTSRCEAPGTAVPRVPLPACKTS